ncbi:C6 finger domain protein [Geosmithia morbida]|uniref:C6 finger domain protein n=1 Tax=Geosmithia morbida TaxID=1094350 RepID=A0A9P4Z3A5_9HYPO|nr:C6 finger domain protein [Geosmithia morbida]KAF4126731.1 C6 finger domain protein [Geosmithia morbida]
MSDPYQHFLSSMSAAGPQQVVKSQEMRPLTPQGAYTPAEGPLLDELNPQPSVYFQDAKPGDSKTTASRKKPSLTNPAVDAVKHRRTRSGCFTCRGRRVKKESTVKWEKTSSLSSGGDYEEQQDEQPTQGLYGSSESRSDANGGSAPNGRASTCTVTPSNQISTPGIGPQALSQDDNRSSPSSSTGTSTIFATVPYDPLEFPTAADGKPDFSHLPPDYQRHLAWYDENVTYHHYGLPHDLEGFFSIILPRMALQNEALLNAVVGFSAYQTTVQNPNGKLQDFLTYYNKAVQILLEILRKREKHGVTTLVAILQIAQIEEYLGDWVNIMGHQRAAHEMFTSLFTPENSMETPVGRMCLSWYARFDAYICFRASFPSGLCAEYFEAMGAYYRKQLKLWPGDLGLLIADRNASLRWISRSQTVLYARRNRGQISQEDFIKEHERHTQLLQHSRDNWDSRLSDPAYLVTDFEGRQPDPDDIGNPYEPGIVFKPPLFTTTLAVSEWHAVMIMHLVYMLPIRPRETLAQISGHAQVVCRYFSAMKRWPHCPKGYLLQQHAVMQAAAPFLPKDEKHSMWIRRQSAFCESKGFIRPYTQRVKMAGFLRDPSCVKWWLPNEEGFTPILRRLREFSEERNAIALTAQQESVKEVPHFSDEVAKLSLED